MPVRTIKKQLPKSWTVADLYRRFGQIPFERIRHDPRPGTATVADVVRIHDRENRLYELVEGVLVEKTVGFLESWLAIRIATLLSRFVESHELGLIAGPDGMIALDVDRVRISDVSFVSWARVPGGAVPTEPVPRIDPDLAVEVISTDNTPKEMNEKLEEYFQKGVRLVWFVRPRRRVVDVYTAPDHFTRLTASMTLDGGDVLSGFAVPVSTLFQMPKPPAKGARKRRKGNGQNGSTI
jgi:Uma2 family endonuclease